MDDKLRQQYQDSLVKYEERKDSDVALEEVKALTFERDKTLELLDAARARISQLEAQLREREGHGLVMLDKLIQAETKRDCAIDRAESAEQALAAARENWKADLDVINDALGGNGDHSVRNMAENRMRDLTAARKAYEAERSSRVRLISAYERNPEDAWRWVGDGSDDLASMGEDMAVLIRAGDLRALRSRSDDSGRVERVKAVVDDYGIMSLDNDELVRELLAAADGEVKL